MDNITFDRLLLKTAFCCMASDGHIDEREIAYIRSVCNSSPLFTNFRFEEEINLLVNRINANSKEFIQNYFRLLASSSLSENEELTLIDFAIKTIQADDKVEYSEIKFFKNIRHRLKISDERILESFPDIEFFLEEDIDIGSAIDNIARQYLDGVEFPKFEPIKLDDPGQSPVV